MSGTNIENELKQAIEMNVEKERLKYTLQLINDEILKYIAYRKKFTEYIVNYRKNIIEEYRDDEDKIVEYFDHERFIKEETYNAVDKKLNELTVLKNSPYFGRVDFSEEDFGVERLYIGRFGLTPEGYDEPVVMDWRAPAASLFYEGKLGETYYKSPSGNIKANVLARRQYIINKGKLEGMFDTEVNIKDEILQRVLSKNADDKLKDIVTTIQKEQDEIIREYKYTTVVVDGCAGSGKTTVALHRVAYLLYNYRNILEDKVLILGPNNIFMEYISNVLPSLGETAVKQTTFTELAKYLLQLYDVMPYKDYMENILKNDSEFIDEVLYKTSEKYIEKLDSIIDDLDKNYFKYEDVEFRDKIIISKEGIYDLHKYYATMPLFKRSKKIKRIIYSKLKDYRDELIRNIEKRFKEEINRYNEKQLNIEITNLEFRRKIEIRDVIKELMQIKKSIDWLENPDCIDIYNRFNGSKQLTIDDLAPILYLKIKLEGFRLENEIKHVVIDEAQDYSKLQFLVIKYITKTPALTILGDTNQRILPVCGEIPMNTIDEIYDNLKIKKFKLIKSYRSTKEIMEFANNYLDENKIVPLVRSGTAVAEKNINSYGILTEVVTDKVMRYREKGYESIAIITKDLTMARKVFDSIKNRIHVRIIDNENVMYHSGIVVLPSYFAKGLEFDSVIFINDCGVKNNKKLKYVMATRALHELNVLNIT